MTGNEQAFATSSGFVLAGLWRATWQGAVAILLVWAVVRALPRLSPAIKNWLWRLAYLKILLAFFWASSIDLPILPVREAGGAALLAPMLPALPVPEFPLPTVLLALWGAGILWILARLGAQWLQVRSIHASSVPVKDAAILGLFENLSERFGLRRPPAILISNSVTGPMLIGLLRPSVILPARHAAELGLEEIEGVLAHELAHVVRRDLWWLWASSTVGALLFFHPLLRLAQRESQMSQECASDQLALAVTRTAPARYGAMLVRIASPGPLPVRMAVGISSSYEGLRRRLLAMQSLDYTAPRRVRLIGAGFALLGISAILPVRLVSPDAPANAAPEAPMLASPATDTSDAHTGAASPSTPVPLQTKKQKYSVSAIAVPSAPAALPPSARVALQPGRAAEGKVAPVQPDGLKPVLGCTPATALSTHVDLAPSPLAAGVAGPDPAPIQSEAPMTGPVSTTSENLQTGIDPGALPAASNDGASTRSGCPLASVCPLGGPDRQAAGGPVGRGRGMGRGFGPRARNGRGPAWASGPGAAAGGGQGMGWGRGGGRGMGPGPMCPWR